MTRISGNWFIQKSDGLFETVCHCRFVEFTAFVNEWDTVYKDTSDSSVEHEPLSIEQSEFSSGTLCRNIFCDQL